MRTGQRIALIAGNALFARAAILRLCARGLFVRVICKTDVAADRWIDLGADQALTGDLSDPDCARTMFEGIDVVLYEQGFDRDEQDPEYPAMLAAIGGSAVDHTIFVSCLKPLTPTLQGFRVRARFEELLAASDLSYSVVQPAIFMQNVSYLLPEVFASARLLWPWNVAKRFRMVDVMDVADAIVRIVADPAVRGGSYELCSGDAVSATDIADMLGRALGTAVTSTRASPRVASQQNRVDAAPGWTPSSLSGGFDILDLHGYAGGSDFTLGCLLERRPRSLDDVLRAAVAVFKENSGRSDLTGESILDAMFASWTSSEL